MNYFLILYSSPSEKTVKGHFQDLTFLGKCQMGFIVAILAVFFFFMYSSVKYTHLNAIYYYQYKFHTNSDVLPANVMYDFFRKVFQSCILQPFACNVEHGSKQRGTVEGRPPERKKLYEKSLENLNFKSWLQL